MTDQLILLILYSDIIVTWSRGKLVDDDHLQSHPPRRAVKRSLLMLQEGGGEGILHMPLRYYFCSRPHNAVVPSNVLVHSLLLIASIVARLTIL